MFGKLCMQNNQLPTKTPVELMDNSITFKLLVTMSLEPWVSHTKPLEPHGQGRKL